MNIQEAHYTVRQLVNKIGSQYSAGLIPLMIDWSLNRAALIVLKRKYKFEEGEGFELDQEAKDNLASLYVRSPQEQPALTPSTAGSKYGVIYEIKFTDLLYPYIHLAGATAKITKEKCGSKYVGLTEVSRNELDSVLVDPHKKSSYKWSKVWCDLGKDTTTLTETSTGMPGSLFIYSCDDFTVDEVQVDYIKLPREVFFGGYNSPSGTYTTTDSPVDFDFGNQDMHEEICRTAATLLTVGFQDPQLLQLQQLNNEIAKR